MTQSPFAQARVEERVKLACLLKSRIRKLNTENTSVDASHKQVGCRRTFYGHF